MADRSAWFRSEALIEARRYPLLRYLGAAASVVGAFGLVALGHHYLGDRTPVYLFFAAAVAVSAGCGGLGPALVATVLSVAVSAVLLVWPIGIPEFSRQGEAQLILFVAVAVLIIGLIEFLRTAYWRAERLRADAEDARSRVAFLAEASTILDASLGYETTLANVARLIVPSMADWCAIDVVEEDNSIRQLGLAHADPAKEDLVRRLQRRYPLNPQGVHPLQKVMATGQPDMYLDIPDSALVSAARDSEHLRLLRDLGFHSYLCAPLVARGRTLGTILFVSARRNHFTSADLSLACDLARRAALAVDNARLFRAATDEIAERRRAEDALRLSETRLSGIIGSAMDAIITYRADHRVVVFNSAAERMFRYAASQAIGCAIERFLPPRDRSAERDGSEPSSDPDGTLRSMSSSDAVVGLRSDGTEFPIEATVSHAEAAGEKLHTVIIRDVTERQQAEAEIRELNERLQRAMTETHHRVKNNLQVIAAMVDMQVMEGSDTVPAHEFRRLGSYVRALAIVHDLLTQESRADAQTQRVSAKALLEKLLPLLQQTTDGAAVVRYSLDDASLTAKQTTSLALVVNELVSNAIKHGRGEVDVRLDVHDGTATLKVLDNGQGFPAEFDPQECANTGLELVDNLSRWDLGGEAHFGNRPDGGGEVTVDIPLDSAAALAAA